MSSSDALQPMQLKLFMTGKELKDQITYSGDLNLGETLDDMWNRKVRESKMEQGVHGAGTYESIQDNGWKPRSSYSWDTHAQLRFAAYKPSMRVADAHHRIAAAADIEEKTGKPTFIPVSYGVDPDYLHHSMNLPPITSSDLHYGIEHRQAKIRKHKGLPSPIITSIPRVDIGDPLPPITSSELTTSEVRRAARNGY